MIYFWRNSGIMKLAIVGATGLVGGEVLAVLEELNLPVTELIPIASARSVGQTVMFRGNSIEVVSIETAMEMKPEVAIFSAGSETSLEFAPKFAALGCFVVDNSSAWRMNPENKLIVPEINGDILEVDDKVIANPNCSTIQMVLALNPLHKAFGLKRVVVSTYQSVTGTGKAAVDQMEDERAGKENIDMVYPHQIDLNVLPHIDVFQENGYTKEEMKMINETHKILGDGSISITATAVRLPVVGGHSESINAEFQESFAINDVFDILENSEGITVIDNPALNQYPMPLHAKGKNDVFVGRIRFDEYQPNTINMWIVADNLRKGAATNAVQIVEKLQEKKFI
jgi:aspartate-semialdehyde dehydrogenase